MPDLQQTFYRMYDAALGRFVAADPMAEASESMTSYQYALNNPIIFNDPLGDKAKMTIFDIINTISANDKGFGGRWSSSNPDNVDIFSNNIEGFAGVTDRLDNYGGWESTLAGNFENAWGNLNGNISSSGSGKEVGLPGVKISETKTNSNWLNDRLSEYANSKNNIFFSGPSDPSSWRFTPAGPNGNYQTAGVAGINFWVLSLNMEGVSGAYITMKTLYFEFPRKTLMFGNKKPVLINPIIASSFMARATDKAISMTDEAFHAADGNMNKYQIGNMFLLNLKTIIQAGGGRVTTTQNYNAIIFIQYRRL